MPSCFVGLMPAVAHRTLKYDSLRLVWTAAHLNHFKPDGGVATKLKAGGAKGPARFLQTHATHTARCGILGHMESPLGTIGRFVIPSVVATHFHLRPGDVVADFGAGSGYFIPTLVDLVGPEGRVYACEIQKQLVEKIGDLARRNGWSQVQPLWSDLEDVGGTKVPDGVLDAAVMVNTFFQLDDKAAAVAEALRTLRTGGKLFLIDWSESFGGLGPIPEQVVDAAAAEALFESNGFIMERTFDAGDHHYGLAFRKL